LPPRQALPLPWWHRAPLGLLDKTPVFLALVGTRTRPVGSLIVSVLNPSDWEVMTIVEGQEPDRSGLVAEAFDAAYPFNIAVAETVTTEAGDKHHISIVCEPFGIAGEERLVGQIAQKLRQRRLKNLQSREFLQALPKILWHDVFQVQHGWIPASDWREQIAKQYPADKLEQVDLDRAVVSADTERRLVRFLFPRRGAMTIRMEHADQPGALRDIAGIFRDCNLNVLSMLLRRGGAKPKNAVLVAICEPHLNTPLEGLRERVTTGLAGLSHRLRAHFEINDPDEPLIYSHHPDELIARVPQELSPLVIRYKRNLPAGELPVFISRRFLESERKKKIVETVHGTLKEMGCIPIEARPEPGQLATSLSQVSAKMWLSRAGIVLVDGGPNQAFSTNLAHEAGFLQGQGKPVLVLVEEGSEKEMNEWTNALGLIAPRFPANEDAFNPDHPASINAYIRRFAESLKEPRQPYEL
jgi:hypothetical protein